MTDLAPATGSPAADPSPVALSPQTRASLRLASWLIASWALLIVVGVLSLRAKEALGASNPVSFARAVFVSANVGSLAGFSLDFAKPDDFSVAVRAVMVLQTLSGLLLSLVGGGVLLARLLNRPYSDGRLTITALAMMAFAAIGGCLTTHVGESAGIGAFRGISALGCGGILFGDMPTVGAALSMLLIPLSFIGSLGVVVINDLINAVAGRRNESGHAGRVLTTTAAVYLIGMGVLAYLSGLDHDTWKPALAHLNSLFWSAHSWGAPIEMASKWHEGLLWPMVAIAVIGVGTAGSAGSIGIAWLVTVPSKLRTMAMNGLVAQLVLASAALATLAFTEPTIKQVPRVLLVVSAVMNLGLSHQPLSITGVGLLALGVTIAVAKVLPLFVFVFALRSKDSL